MKNFIIRYKLYILSAFALAEAAIYIAFMTVECTSGANPVMLKYSGILLCLLTSALVCPACGKDGIMLVCAFIFTAVSDMFIFVLDGFYEVGVSTFIVTQIFYFARIYLALGKKPYISIAVRAVLAGAAMLALGLTGNLIPLTALVAIYFPMLVCNAVESALLIKNSKIYILFFVGLLLFIGCDICVGLNNFAGLGISLPAGVVSFVGIAMWAFYLPSQTLIALSARIPERTAYEK